MARAECNTVEPDLMPTDQPDHLAACLFWEELVAVEDATELFGEDVVAP